jgi:hypothetical protein
MESINYREMMAVYFVLKIKQNDWFHKNILIQTDNITTAAYINHQGGPIEKLSDLAIKMFNICLPGKMNNIADWESRVRWDRNDWKLNPMVFEALNRIWGPLTLDLFATRNNRQVKSFYSWRPDPEALGTDAFNQIWPTVGAYANPPWILINRVLGKVKQDKARIVIITPLWKGQSWFGEILQMTVATPMILPHTEDLFLPVYQFNQEAVGAPKWKAIAWLISGVDGECKDFQKRLSRSWKGPRGLPQENSMTQIIGSIWSGVRKKVLIPAKQLIVTR